MKLAEVRNDIAFHKIFGNENRTEALISFLNAVLGFEELDKIVSITILNPYQLPKLRSRKVSTLDIQATDQQQQQFIVEIQVADQDSLFDHVLCYMTKDYSSHIRRADQYRKLKPTYFLGILYNLSHTQNPNYISRSCILDVDTGEVTLRGVEFNFIDLSKFNKKINELDTLSDKWIYFIKNAEDLKIIPNNTDDKGLLAAYEDANQHDWTQEELDAYDYVHMREEDGRAQLAAAKRKGKRKGKEEKEKEEMEMKMGIEMKKGMEIGREITVIGAYRNNISISIITKFLKITEEKVMQIINKYEQQKNHS